MDEDENTFPMDFYVEDPSPRPWKFRPEGYLVMQPVQIGTPKDAAHRRIASAEMSMSFSVVDQLEIEIRIAPRPCQIVPPTQHVPSRWIDAMTAAVRSSGPAVVVGGRSEADQDLVEDDIVEDRDPGRGGEPLRDPAGERAASVYELGGAGSTERAERGVDAEASGVARRFGYVVVRLVRLPSSPHQVGSGHGHRCPVGGRVCHEHDPAVIRNVEPFLRVGGP